jgi:hypothetical protein
MPDNNQQREQPEDTRGRRLRVDTERVEAGRRFLEQVDATVFRSTDKHADDAHTSLVARIVSALFARG